MQWEDAIFRLLFATGFFIRDSTVYATVRYSRSCGLAGLSSITVTVGVFFLG